MNACLLLLNVVFFIHFVLCRDFYIGMFKKNDLLVAQDVVYKEASHFGYTYASYGRLFKCPITFFRVVDRLGMGRGPYTTVVRGGLRKKYITVRIKSTYNLPISVNIYVGCANKGQMTTRTISTAPTETSPAGAGTGVGGDGAAEGGAPGGETTAAAGAEGGAGAGGEAGGGGAGETEPGGPTETEPPATTAEGA